MLTRGNALCCAQFQAKYNQESVYSFEVRLIGVCARAAFACRARVRVSVCAFVRVRVCGCAGVGEYEYVLVRKKECVHYLVRE